MRHHIQRQILDDLSRAETLRYSDINSHTLEGNTFTYHVKQLIADKFIVQNPDKTYSLTPLGKTYIVHRYEDQAAQAHSIFLVIVRCDNQLLLRERAVQPLLGYSGFIHGEPVAGVPIEHTAAVRVQVKTGLRIAPTVLSSGLIAQYSNDLLVSFSHAVVLQADVSDAELLIMSDATGRNFWHPLSELPGLDMLLPSCHDLLNLDNGEWFDLQYTL